MEASAGLLGTKADARDRLVVWAVLVAIPLAGLVILLAAPGADFMWEHHPSHFWLVLATAVTSAALAFSTSGVALRRADAVFAAASALPLGPERARAVIRHATLLRGALLAVMAAGAALSLGWVPPLDDPTPAERASGALLVLDRLAVPLYGLAGWRYLTIGIRSGSPILLALAGACILLAEAMLAVAFARSWHASWWEWHLLILAAFGAIAWSARREEPEERFSDLYLDDTAAGKRVALASGPHTAERGAKPLVASAGQRPALPPIAPTAGRSMLAAGRPGPRALDARIADAAVTA